MVVDVVVQLVRVLDLIAGIPQPARHRLEPFAQGRFDAPDQPFPQGGAPREQVTGEERGLLAALARLTVRLQAVDLLRRCTPAFGALLDEVGDEAWVGAVGQ